GNPEPPAVALGAAAVPTGFEAAATSRPTGGGARGAARLVEPGAPACSAGPLTRRPGPRPVRTARRWKGAGRRRTAGRGAATGGGGRPRRRSSRGRRPG